MARNPLILIVDANPRFVELFSIKLNTAGYRVEVAANGAIGVEKAKQLKPDLILMGVEIPDTNCADTFDAIRKNDPEMHTKVAFLTDFPDSEPETMEIHNRVAKEVGAMCCFRKTDDFDNLLARVREVAPLT